MYKILIVEDDPVIGKVLKEYLEKWNYEVHLPEKFDNIMKDFLETDPHLVVMDIKLPFFSGYHWCSEIRKVSNVPIIFASSESDNMNLIMAINMGGDDFVCKPYDLNVILAKIQAMLRRTYAFAEKSANVIEYNGAVLNMDDFHISYDGKDTELTKNEFKIMQTLMQSTGKAVSRDDIITALWEDENFIDDNTLTVNVTRIRKKLEKNLGLKNFIKTIKGVGYIIGE